jgi:hypothetical protein
VGRRGKISVRLPAGKGGWRADGEGGWSRGGRRPQKTASDRTGKECRGKYGKFILGRESATKKTHRDLNYDDNKKKEWREYFFRAEETSQSHSNQAGVHVKQLKCDVQNSDSGHLVVLAGQHSAYRKVLSKY